MPELAEVETVRRVLTKQILNKKIVDINIYYPRMIENNAEEFKLNLINSSFKNINRKGKYLLFETSDYTLISHLRMEGKYFIKNDLEPKGKHEHVKFSFEDGTSLRYEDVRKFGTMHLVKSNELNNDNGLSKQGIEANSEDLTKEYLFEKIKLKKVPMKSLLLDQTIISGLGNIYADEVLFSAFINPLRFGNTISLDECENLVESSKRIINNAIMHGGTTIRSYTSSLGVIGGYQDYLKVHTKDGEACLVCNQNIERIKVGGRSTYFCPNCQK